MSQDIKYVSTKTQHTWECPECGTKLDKVTHKMWNSFTLNERLRFAEKVFYEAEIHRGEHKSQKETS